MLFRSVYTCLTRDGKVFSTDKSVWMQGRCAWTFSYPVSYTHLPHAPRPASAAQAAPRGTYIKSGVLDQNTPAALVQDYFDLIQAPKKELIWFEQSGRCV